MVILGEEGGTININHLKVAKLEIGRAPDPMPDGTQMIVAL